jgi:hypothetical protein
MATRTTDGRSGGIVPVLLSAEERKHLAIGDGIDADLLIGSVGT